MSKDVVNATGGAPTGTVAEDARLDAGATQPGKDGTSLKQEAEKSPNVPRSEVISGKGTLESQLAGTEQSSTLTQRDAVDGPNGQSSALPNELDPMPIIPASQAAPIPCVGNALSKSFAVVGGEGQVINTGDGTVVAQMENVMKTMVKGNKSAVKVEQKLPRASLAEIETTDSDFSEKEKASDASAVKVASSAIPWVPLTLDDRFQGWSAKLELASGVKSAATSEQLYFQISKQAVALKHFNADSMAVVLKPDPETAIFLHLQLQNGLVEVHARFERGDYQALQAGWEQLRQSLATQGIRLGPLQNSLSNDYIIAGQTSDSLGYGKGAKYSDPQTPDRADAMAEVFSGPRAEVSRRPISQSPGREKRPWEHWA